MWGGGGAGDIIQGQICGQGEGRGLGDCSGSLQWVKVIDISIILLWGTSSNSKRGAHGDISMGRGEERDQGNCKEDFNR